MTCIKITAERGGEKKKRLNYINYAPILPHPSRFYPSEKVAPSSDLIICKFIRGSLPPPPILVFFTQI